MPPEHTRNELLAQARAFLASTGDIPQGWLWAAAFGWSDEWFHQLESMRPQHAAPYDWSNWR